MTPEAQRIAIAEACGWTYQRTDADGGSFGWVSPRGGCLQNAPKCFPNYTEDLNAMHEAEKVLTGAKDDEHSQKQAYYEELIFVVGGYQTPADCYEWDLMTASAAQRAESFLRVLGKWKEDA